MRIVYQKLYEANYQNSIRLSDYSQNREYIVNYRAFEKWQQAFQARKMEEHLCLQNLAYYEHQKRQEIMRLWQLTTACKILSRCKAFNTRKKTFTEWHRESNMIVSSRKERLLTRFLACWRRVHRTSVSNEMIWSSNRKTLRLTFSTWRGRAKSQIESHHQSVEFIGSSSLRYFLQKWRMETTMRRYSQLKKPYARTVWPLENNNSITANYAPRYTSNSFRFPTNERRSILLGPVSVADADFIV